MKFSRFLLYNTGDGTDLEMVRVISEFFTQTYISELVLQLSQFNACPDNHDAAFENVKKMLQYFLFLAYYDPGNPTALHTDVSRLHGLGFVLTKQQPNNTLVGSRILSEAESRYATTEFDMLAIAWAWTNAKHSKVHHNLTCL